MLIFINHDDIRSLELMEELIRRGYYVSDQFKDMKYADVIYLGLKGIDNKNRLSTGQETICISEETFNELKENVLVYTLVENKILRDYAYKGKLKYCALLNDEDFIKKNSILTAEGLISYLIKHRRFPLYESRVLILGYGYCAKPIAEYLKVMKAKVSVAVRNHKYQQEIEELDYCYEDISELNLANYDVIINTVPSLVVKQEGLDQVKKDVMIVDIASYPYGIDHHYAMSQGLNSIILPSIPCKYAYGYAGRIIADQIERELEND